MRPGHPVTQVTNCTFLIMHKITISSFSILRSQFYLRRYDDIEDVVKTKGRFEETRLYRRPPVTRLRVECDQAVLKSKSNHLNHINSSEYPIYSLYSFIQCI